MKRTLVMVVMLAATLSLSAQDLPQSYRVENTGASFTAPYCPSLEELPVQYQLPDPLAWADGSGRVDTFID